MIKTIQQVLFDLEMENLINKREKEKAAEKEKENNKKGFYKI